MRFFPREGTVKTLAFFGALALPALLRGAPWVVITEIHYNPPGGEDQEFVEILNREPPRVDISGWRIEGDIVHLPPAVCKKLEANASYALIASDSYRLSSLVQVRSSPRASRKPVLSADGRRRFVA